MRTILFALLLGLLAITWWALQPGGEDSFRGHAAKGDVVDYFVEQLELTTFGADGIPLRRLEAVRMDHYRGSGETRLAQPRFQLFGKKNELWNIVSQSGTLSENQERLLLEGAVEIQRTGGPGQLPLDIHTSNLLVKPGEEYAETSEPVKIISDGNWTSAVGMRAWLRPPIRIQFLARTRAHYAVQ